MRTLIAIALLLVSCSTAAAAAAPICTPSLANPPEHVERLDAVLTNGDDTWASWKCTDGLHIDTFQMSRMLPLLAKAATGILTAAEVQAAYDAWPKASQEELDRVRRRVVVDYYGAQPRVLTPVAYRRRETINAAASHVRIGTVAVGEPCEKGGKYGTLMLIDRSKVTKDSSLAVLPTTAYAICG
jgi:hypothetical protein